VEIRQRIDDMLESYPTIFRDDEIEFVEHSLSGLAVMKSIEYYQIVHMTNEEHYYLDDTAYRNIKAMADEMLPTKAGLILCYK
jgi:hypothetical protein